MLTFRHIRFNILAFKLCSRMALLPIDVHEVTGQVSLSRSKFVWFKWRSFLVLHILHCAFINVRLLQYIQKPGSIRNPENQFYLLFVSCVVSTYMIYWWRELFIKSGSTVLHLMNECLSTIVSKEDAKAPWSFHQLRKLSNQELLIIYMPWMLAGGVIGGTSLALVDPNSTQLIFSVLPPGYKTPWVFVLLLPLEAFFMVFWVTVMYVGFLNQLLAGEKCLYELRGCLNLLKYRTLTAMDGQQSSPSSDRAQGLKDAIANLRKLQTFITTFNTSQRNILLCNKFMSYIIAITSIYFAITSFSSRNFNAVVVLFNLQLGVDSSVAFTIMYGKLVSIPEFIAHCKQEILWAHTRDNANRASRKNQKDRCSLSKVISSIPLTGFQQGQFNTLERASILNFVDTVVTKVATLLVMKV